jgi:hypothetical protein
LGPNINLRTPCQTSSICNIPLVLETSFHTHTKTTSNIIIKVICLSVMLNSKWTMLVKYLFTCQSAGTVTIWLPESYSTKSWLSFRHSQSKVVSGSAASDFYSEDVWFESWSEFRLSWLRCFIIFFNSSTQNITQKFPTTFLGGGVRLSPLGTSIANWSILPAPNDRWWVSSSRWNDSPQAKPKYSEKTCPSASLSTTNPT